MASERRTIWKQVLTEVADTTFTAPRGAKPLTVAIQNGQPCVWYECDVQDIQGGNAVLVTVKAIGTGHFFELFGDYIGSTVHHHPESNEHWSSALVWHWFWAESSREQPE